MVHLKRIYDRRNPDRFKGVFGSCKVPVIEGYNTGVNWINKDKGIISHRLDKYRWRGRQ